MSKINMSTELPKYRVYELVVADVLRKFDQNAKVQHDIKKISSNGKRQRQIDVYIEGKISGMDINIMVDCKYYTKKLDVKDVEEFIGMVEDIKPNLGILISPLGFTTGAIDRVKEYGTRISLCSIFDGNHIEYSTPLGVWLYRIERKELNVKISIRNGKQAMRHPLPIPELWLVEDMFGRRITMLEAAAKAVNEDKSLTHLETGIIHLDPDKYLFVDGNRTITLSEIKVWFDSVVVVGKKYVKYVNGIAIVKENSEVTALTTLSTNVVDLEGGYEILTKKEKSKFLKDGRNNKQPNIL